MVYKPRFICLIQSKKSRSEIERERAAPDAPRGVTNGDGKKMEGKGHGAGSQNRR
jgi:hypothetical protein